MKEISKMMSLKDLEFSELKNMFMKANFQAGKKMGKGN
jgi:hypothetical protein